MYQGAQWKGQHVAITTSITTSIINGVRAIEEQGHREDYRVPLPVPYASERHSGIQNILTAVIKNTLVRLVVRTPPPEDEAAQSGPTTLDRGLVRPCGPGGSGRAEPTQPGPSGNHENLCLCASGCAPLPPWDFHRPWP